MARHIYSVLVLLLALVGAAGYLAYPKVRQWEAIAVSIADSQARIAVSSEKASEAAAAPKTPTALRATDLEPGQFLVAGVSDRPYMGASPSLLLANIPNATEMRLGNTEEELAAAEWQPYASERSWLARSGEGERVVYAEFRANGATRRLTALVPHGAPVEENHLKPAHTAHVLDAAIPYTWDDTFDQNNGLWSSYDFNAGVHGWGNVFYPATWHSDGYIWTDDSRWRIDTPESPQSILALLVYPTWLATTPRSGTISLEGARIEFDIKTDDLDLKGGAIRFWFVTKGRWTSRALQVPAGEWTSVSIAVDDEPWTQSWDGRADDEAPDLTGVFSFGIKFDGFRDGEEPTGRISLDNVRITPP